MGLNIKNPETHRLAEELAAQLGTTLTEAVTVALRDKLAASRSKSQRDARVEKIMKIARRMAEQIGPQGLPDHDALLYDARGLPKGTLPE